MRLIPSWHRGQMEKMRPHAGLKQNSLFNWLVQHSGPEVVLLFQCPTQLSTKFILLINIKMPTIVGILTFISMINTTYECSKARKSVFCGILVFMSSLNFVLSWVEYEKSFITPRLGLLKSLILTCVLFTSIFLFQYVNVLQHTIHRSNVSSKNSFI